MADNPDLDRWNARFSGDEYLFGTEPNAFLASQSRLLRQGQKALSIADGEGRNGVWLARQGLQVTSVDFSPVAVAKARRLAIRHGVELTFECADLARWEWGTSRFDVVVAIFIQFAAPALRELIFRRMREALRPGGLVLLQGYRPEQLVYKTGGPSKMENLYTARLLQEAFGDLEILHLAGYDASVAEGSGHSGMSALIDLVARKSV